MKFLINKIKTCIEGQSQRSHSVLFGSATAAIIAVLKVLLRDDQKKVVVPVNVCPSLIVAIYAGGKIPIYLDINENGGMSYEELCRLETKPDAVIAVHSYGNPCEIEKIENYCNENEILLVEDAAVSFGASISKRKAGAFGKVSVLSFGAGKIVSCGGGGAALTNDTALALELEKLSLSHEQQDEWLPDAFSRLHTFIYNNFRGDRIASLSYIFKTLAIRDHGRWSSAFNDKYAEKLYYELSDASNGISLRMENYHLYSDYFEKAGIPFLRLKEGAVCWRFCLFMPETRDRILEQMLSVRDKVSSWYPPVAPYFDEQVQREWPVAVKQGSEILNLWVNQEVDKKMVIAYAQKVSDIHYKALHK